MPRCPLTPIIMSGNLKTLGVIDPICIAVSIWRRSLIEYDDSLAVAKAEDIPAMVNSYPQGDLKYHWSCVTLERSWHQCSASNSLYFDASGIQHLGRYCQKELCFVWADVMAQGLPPDRRRAHENAYLNVSPYR